MISLAMACAAPVPEKGGVDWSYPLDDVLRLTDAQTVGTHNSYHVEPDPLLTDEWAYTHAPLSKQAGDYGVRQFELDVHYDAATDDFLVYHAIGVDEQSTCATFGDCLGELADWSASAPAALPLAILVEPKDDAGGGPITNHWKRFDEIIAATWGDRIFRPEELRSGADSLHDAVMAQGWPTLSHMRGRALCVILDHESHRSEYLETPDSRACFVPGESLDDPESAVFLLDDATTDAQTIADASAAGFLVRTFADASREAVEGNDKSAFEMGLAAGAHFFSTDFPVAQAGRPYVITIPDGTPAGCNPVTAPPECTAESLEDPQWIP